MKISKKIFAVLLAVVMIFSVFAVGAFAVDEQQEKEAMTVTITTDKGADSYEMKDTVKVTVSIACNYNVPTFRFPILYDKSVLETPTLLGLEAKNTCLTGTINSNKFADCTPSEDGGYGLPTVDGAACVPENYDAEQWGAVLVQWVGDVKNGAVTCINNPEGEVAFTFNLKVKSGTAGKTGTIFIPSESDLLYYQAMEDPTVATSFYYLDAETCDMTFVPANVTVAAANVALIPNADTDSKAVVDEENLIVYGFDTGIASVNDIKNFVAATGGARIRAAQTELGYGTGTEINLQLDGVTVKTYKIVIFGDANGDAVISPADFSYIAESLGGTVIIDDNAVKKALDLNPPPDNMISPADFSVMSEVIGGTISIDQTNPYAE